MLTLVNWITAFFLCEAVVRLDLSFVFLLEIICFFIIPNLNTLDLLVILANAVNVPIDHIGAFIFRFFLADFHNADSVSVLKRRPVAFVFVCIHICKASRNSAGNQR